MSNLVCLAFVHNQSNNKFEGVISSWSFYFVSRNNMSVVESEFKQENTIRLNRHWSKLFIFRFLVWYWSLQRVIIKHISNWTKKKLSDEEKKTPTRKCFSFATCRWYNWTHLLEAINIDNNKTGVRGVVRNRCA